MRKNRIALRAEGSIAVVTGLPDPGARAQTAAILYDALHDWLVRERLVDAGQLPAGRLYLTPDGDRTLITVRGIPIGRMAGSTLELFMPPYVRGATAVQTLRELARVLKAIGFTDNPIVEPGGNDGKQTAA